MMLATGGIGIKIEAIVENKDVGLFVGSKKSKSNWIPFPSPPTGTARFFISIRFAEPLREMTRSPGYKIFKIQGPNGNFGIASAGAGPEGRSFLYEDEKYHFVFQADIEPT